MNSDIRIEKPRLRRLSIARKAKIVLAVLFGVLLITAIVLATNVYSLGPGEVAVVYDPITGSFSKPHIGPVFFIKLPWQGVIKDFYTIDYISMTSEADADYPPVSALTKDGVEVTIEVTFTYEINPRLFDELAKYYPRIDYEQSRLIPTMRQIVRDAVAKYSVDELITNRDKVAKEIEKLFIDTISKDPTLKAIKIHEVNLRGIKLPEKVEQAIEAKVAAYQEKLAAQYQREKILTLANATAMEKIIVSQAEAEALKIRVEALKRALLELYNATHDIETLRIYVFTEQISKLPQNIVIVLGQTTPLISIPTPTNTSQISSGD